MMKAGQVGRRATWDCVKMADLGVEWDVPDDAEWDDKGRNMISYICVSFDRIIRSIQFGYLENDALVLSEMHGTSEGPYSSNAYEVRLKQDEYVTGLSGELGLCEGIRNLTFHTNRGKHGPVGSYVSGSKIEIDPVIRDRCEFGGFFGSYNTNCLSSIGIYVSPIASSNTVVESENI